MLYMLQAGLLEEISQLRELFVDKGLALDYTKGILQAIGKKTLKVETKKDLKRKNVKVYMC